MRLLLLDYGSPKATNHLGGKAIYAPVAMYCIVAAWHIDLAMTSRPYTLGGLSCERSGVSSNRIEVVKTVFRNSLNRVWHDETLFRANYTSLSVRCFTPCRFIMNGSINPLPASDLDGAVIPEEWYRTAV